jgi:hypothetical protein
MAGPIPPEALYNALTVETQGRTMPSDTTSQDILLDEESIALNDLSYQRSLNQDKPLQAKSAVVEQFQTSSPGGDHRRSRTLQKKGTTDDVLALGRFYQRMGKLSIIPRYMVFIIPVAMVIAVPLVIGACFPDTELGVTYTGGRVLIVGSEDTVDFYVGGDCLGLALGI